MLLTDRKLERRITELKEYRYRDIIHIPSFVVKEDTQKLVNPSLPTDFSDFDTMNVGESWSGRDKYLWLHAKISVPSAWHDKKVVGIFDFGNTGAGNNSGFESMLYLHQKPYQGVDVNHKEVFFTEEFCGNESALLFRLWSGLEGGGMPQEQVHKIARADIAWLDQRVDAFYYMGAMILDTVKNLSDSDAEKHNLRVALDSACHNIDWSYPGSEEFYASVYCAAEALDNSIEKMNKKSNVLVKCVGHTHIDVAWLWRLKHTHEKISRSFSTVLRLMEQYPEYIFLQSQPQLYEYIKQDFPEIFQKIKERVAEGRWEADGAMWVEADCNLTSGESLTRQILFGSKFIKDEFGKDVSYLWLPDVFGYSWALPQILKKCGIDMFMTTKISWNQFNRMPHDTFRWKGLDGSEVLAHFITTPDPWSEPGSWFYTYNGQLTPKTVKGVWDAYSEKDINHELLISYGYGDGGGGVNRDTLEHRRAIDKIPGLPRLETSTAGEYFANLKKTFNETSQFVHTWDGELYLEYHRGTYTSQCYNKKMNRKMEQLFRKAEWLNVMGTLCSGKSMNDTQQEKLTGGWKNILTNQFHDIIPGSSIREVYEDCHDDYKKIEKIGTDVVEEAYGQLLSAENGTFTVFNETGFVVSELVKLDVTEPCHFEDEYGTVLPSQEDGKHTIVYVINVPSMGMKTIYKKTGEREEVKTNFIVNKKEIETPFYIVSFNEYGQFERLFDKENGREVIAPGERANVLQFFEDKPLDNDAWDIDIFYQEKMREVSDLSKFEITCCGELKLAIHLEWQYMNTKIAQDVVFYSNSRRIDFETFVDFREKHQLLKVAFPVDIRTTYGTYDIQYGNVRRPNHWNTSWDIARFESVAHRFVDLSERDYGVSLLNDCKYGHDIKGNVMRLSLLRGATHPDYLQDQGEHTFTYSLFPHAGDFVAGGTVQAASLLNTPLTVVSGKRNCDFDSFIRFEGGHVELDAVKAAEDGKATVIRFHEYAGSKSTVTIKLGSAYQEWTESDLLERDMGDYKTGDLILTLSPYEIKTILLKI